MYKLLILEDEIWISALIKSFIQNNFHQIEIIKECQNGSQALEAISQLSPDIALVDINVPLLNGLEVIAETVKENTHCRFVVITGYKDFEYVHQALKSGVEDYLLKPIEEKELCTVLQKIISDLELEDHSRETVVKSSNFLKMQFLKSISFQSEYNIPDTMDFSQYNLHFEGGLFCCAVFKLLHKQLTYILPHTLDTFGQKFKSLFDEMLKPICHDAFYYYQGSYFVLTLNPKPDSVYLVGEVIVRLFDLLLTYAETELLNITAGISQVHDTGTAGLIQAYKEAIFSLQARISLGSNRTIFYAKDIAADSVKLDFNLAPGDQKELTKLVYTQNSLGLTRWFNHILDHYIQQHNIMETETLCVLCVLDCIAASYCGEVNKLNVLTLDKNVLLEQLDTCNTITELRDEFLNQMKKLNTIISEKLEEQTLNSSINLACRYIEQHLNEPLTLDTVARQVYLNSNYLSELFKTETGINFKDYITEKRMDLACKLLKTPMKITDIALQAGYKDAKHFSKSFKKHLGISPREYQRIHN